MGEITIVSETYENVAAILLNSVSFLLSLCILSQCKVGYFDQAVDPIRRRKTAINFLQQLQSPRNSGPSEDKNHF